MLSAFNTSKTLSFIETLPENLHSSPACQKNPFQKSEILSLHLINSERFADLNSFSLRNFALNCESNDRNPLQFGFEREYEVISLEDPLYNVLSLQRGKSECYLGDQEQLGNVQQYFVEEPTALIDFDTIDSNEVKCQLLSSNMDLPFLPEHEESEGDSKNMLSSSNETQPLVKESESAQGKVSTKNVTKNMGKLLFKYIWKNRISLRKNFNIPSSEWESFIGDIRVWKKENNVTREFLNSRWHSTDRNSKIFRMISHNFFRTRCLSAIIQSKIECKEMHIKRLRRFQEATFNASALDNLN